jgi:dynein heavy chain
MAALESLDRRELGNCKAMNKAPPGVEDVFGAVMVLLAGINPHIYVQKNGRVREKERTWDSSKKALLSNVNSFLDELKGFKTNIDEGTVPETNWKEVRPFLQMDHFVPEIIEKRNAASAGLCSWVVNIVNYYDIVMLVEPKRLALRTANDALNKSHSRLSGIRTKLVELQSRLDLLTVQYNTAEKLRSEAQQLAEKGEMNLERALRLTKALGNETAVWGADIERLTLEKEFFVGDCLLAATFVGYIGPFTKQYRETFVEEMLLPFFSKPPVGAPIAITPDIDVIGLISSAFEVAEYETQGLPKDITSSENAAITLNSLRYTLMIDPQLQGVKWIKNREGKDLQVGRMADRDICDRYVCVYV